MANMSKVVLCGNLTRDPELKYTTGGTAVVTLGVAVNRRVKKGDNWESEANFFDVTVFGKSAENCAEYLGKGSGILVEGELVQRRWEAQDGQNRSKVEVIARDVQFLGKGDSDRPSKPQVSDGGATEPPPIDDDNLPF